MNTRPGQRCFLLQRNQWRFLARRSEFWMLASKVHKKEYLILRQRCFLSIPWSLSFVSLPLPYLESNSVNNLSLSSSQKTLKNRKVIGNGLHSSRSPWIFILTSTLFFSLKYLTRILCMDERPQAPSPTLFSQRCCTVTVNNHAAS